MPKPIKFKYRFRLRMKPLLGNEYGVFYRGSVFPIIDWAKEHLEPNTWRYFGQFTHTPFEICFQFKEDADMFDTLFKSHYVKFRYLKLGS